jgi:hypothetical protein
MTNNHNKRTTIIAILEIFALLVQLLVMTKILSQDFFIITIVLLWLCLFIYQFDHILEILP